MSTVLDVAALDKLAGTLRGELIRPDDPRYDTARRVWNGAIDRRPALIARCSGVADVIAVVALARSTNLPLAVRCGGHGLAGHGTCDDGIVLDLSPMKDIRIDPEARTARVEGGVTWGELDRESQQFGLATTGGVVSTTGVAGLTLGGGLGWLMRKHGLSCDNLISADVVTADGSSVVASAEQNPDLFWALRGGGGNFGVVTSFQFRLHPVGPTVFAGALFFEADRATELLRMFREWAPGTPEELGLVCALTTAPPAPFVPAQLQGEPAVAVALCFSGPAEDGERHAGALRELKPVVDMLGPMPYTAVQTMFDEAYPHGVRSYWKSALLRELDDDGIGALVGAMATRPSPGPEVIVEVLAGAPLRVGADETAYGRRSEPLSAMFMANWDDPSDDGAHVEWARRGLEAIAPQASGVYLNYLGDEGDQRVRAAYGDDHYERLTEVKARYDPENLFRLNQNIPPRR